MKEVYKHLLKHIGNICFAITLGISLYFISIKFIFNPNFDNLYNVGIMLLYNIGNPNLKLKAYIPIILATAPLIILLIMYLMNIKNNKEEYGNAEFAKEKNFNKMGINYEKGLVLGALTNNKGNPTKFLRANMPLSALIVAPPGSGKTAGIALPNLLSIPNSMVAYDIKGELYQKTAGYRQKEFNNIILKFSPLKDDNTCFFNPFDNKIINDMDFVEMKILADQIAGTIFVGEKGKETDHWLVSAKTMFSFFALYNMQKYRHTTLGDLAQAQKKDYFEELTKEFQKQCFKIDEHTGEEERDFEKDTLKTFFLQVANDETLHDITRNQARAYSTAAKEEFASIKSTYDTYMAVFNNPQVANAVSKMSFNFKDLREHKITIYVVIETEEIDILAPLIRIFTESMFKKLMSGEECSDSDKFIYVMADEFVRFGKMPFLLEAPALCRSYGLIPVFITQSYEQIKKYYGEDDLAIIRANVGYQVIFTMNSKKDAQELSEMIGDYTRNKISTSKGNMDILKHNESVSKEAYKLVTYQDIMNMPNTDSLILIKGFPKNPIKAKVNYWFKNEKWKEADKIAIDNELNNKFIELCEQKPINNEIFKQNEDDINNDNLYQFIKQAKVS